MALRHALRRRVGDVLRHEVVARLVDDRVEVREHAEVGRVLDLRVDDAVRRASGRRRVVDVEGGHFVAEALERGLVGVEIARRRVVAGRVHVGRYALVVLGGDDEHALLGGVLARRGDAVAEFLLQAAREHDHVDDVTRDQGAGAEDGGDRRAPALEVVARHLAVALARRGGRHRDHRGAVADTDHGGADVGRAERLADDRLDLLRAAVGDVEAVELDVLGRLDLVVVRVVVVVLRPVELTERVAPR